MPRTARVTQQPKPRRIRGEGALYQTTRKWKTKDGRTRERLMWVAAISEQAIEGGVARRKRKFFYGKTSKDARAARDSYLAEAGKREPQDTDPSITIAECVECFVEDVRNRKKAATTQQSYKHTLTLHIVPRVGKLKLTEFGVQNAKTLYEGLRRDGLSASAIARCHAVLRTMLNFAVEEELVAVNPLLSLRRTAPRYKTPKVDAPTADQIKAILKAAKGHRLEALFELAAKCGMRQGELFALRWRDVDIRGKFLSVERSAQEVAGIVDFVPPKTAASRRRIELSESAVAALQRRRAIAKAESHASELVFPSAAGHPLRKSNFQRRDWDPVRQAAGVPTLHFHGLRHGCATMMLSEGVHAKVAAERLGHSQVRTTLDIYSHVVPGLQASAAQAIERALRRRRRD